MLKRFHVASLSVGVQRLDPVQARHLRDVMRIDPGQCVELFDASGQSAEGTVAQTRPDVLIEVKTIRAAAPQALELVVASAVPKGPRADWMIEKLSELGAARFIPLHAARSVVVPESGKRTRWTRIAEESAKQSRRPGVMQIDTVMTVNDLLGLAGHNERWCLSTAPGALPLSGLIGTLPPGRVLATIGPEGGWTDAELGAFSEAAFRHVSLTSTILRIETAAVALASVVMCVQNRKEHA